MSLIPTLRNAVQSAVQKKPDEEANIERGATEMATKTKSERIVETVAAYANTEPVELPPIYGAIDPDALDKVVDSMSEGEISFTYAGYPVTVDSDGEIEVSV